MSERVMISVDAGVADVRLNRPDKMNALDPAMFEAMVAAIARIGTMNDVRAVVLSGNGPVFCAGLDMASMKDGLDGDLVTRTYGQSNLFQHVAFGWRELRVPVIAAVHGVAFGGGFQIMSGADIRIAAGDTRMAIMEAKWGLVPDMAGIALWRTLVRDDVLRELAYTAREFDGNEALRHGFVTRIADDPREAAFAVARAIADRNPDAVRAIKRLVNAMPDSGTATILQTESHEQQALIGSPNQVEAVVANMTQRPPVFIDRA